MPPNAASWIALKYNAEFSPLSDSAAAPWTFKIKACCKRMAYWHVKPVSACCYSLPHGRRQTRESRHFKQKQANAYRPDCRKDTMLIQRRFFGHIKPEAKLWTVCSTNHSMYRNSATGSKPTGYLSTRHLFYWQYMHLTKFCILHFRCDSALMWCESRRVVQNQCSASGAAYSR